MIAKVQLWGRTIGAVSLDEGREVASFQYDPEFAGSGAGSPSLLTTASADGNPW